MSKEWGIIYHHGGDCVKTKVGLKKNRTILPISFGKVRLTTNYRMVSGHIHIPTEQHMLDNTKMV